MREQKRRPSSARWDGIDLSRTTKGIVYLYLAALLHFSAGFAWSLGRVGCTYTSLGINTDLFIAACNIIEWIEGFLIGCVRNFELHRAEDHDSKLKTSNMGVDEVRRWREGFEATREPLESLRAC